MVPVPLLAFFGVGDTEMMLVLAVVLMLFGGKKMPELARGMGKALREFRRATGDVEREFRRVMDEAEHQTITPLKTAFETPPHVTPAAVAAPLTTPPVPPDPSPPSAPAALVAPLAPPPRPLPPIVHPPEDFHSDI